MDQVANWLKKTVVNLIDPEKEPRVQSLATAIEHALQTKKSAFTIAGVLNGIEPYDDELALAKERVYRGVMERAWKDGKTSDTERQTLQWLADRLTLSKQFTQRLDREFATNHFALSLAQAMRDGVLDAQEEKKLEEIAKAAGQTLPEFARSYFQTQGEAFLRSIFLACVADNQISQNDWNYLLHVTRRLGFQHDELLTVIHVQSRQFVEHILADSKSDGRITESEERTLHWLVDNLGLPDDYRMYVRREVELLRNLTHIASGRLPSLSPPTGIGIRAGEIVHLHTPAAWQEVRLLKNGPIQRRHEGTITLTDNRLIFSSSTKPFSANYRKVVSHRGGLGTIAVQLENKPEIAFFVHRESPIPYAIFEMALGMANQTKLAMHDGSKSRHIARDVRQRVWQLCGGRCVECNADDYLEYDHIIPVAKGGSNGDGNIQLLCRRCNLKKSDSI